MWAIGLMVIPIELFKSQLKLHYVNTLRQMEFFDGVEAKTRKSQASFQII